MLEKTKATLLVSLWVSTSFLVPGAHAQGDAVVAPEVVWTFETGGPIWGSSTSKDGVVYFGSSDGNVYALDVDTGELVWSFETGGPIHGSVAVYGDYLYAGSDDGNLYKLALADGVEIWKSNLHEAPPLPRHRPADTSPGNMAWDYRGSAPVEVDGLVYVGSADRRLYALHAETGIKAWHFETGNIIRSSPVVAGARLVFGSFDRHVYALDKNTGKEIWRYNTGGIVSTAPVIHDGRVYIGSRSARLYALSLERGTVIWTKPYGQGSWVESAGVVRDNTLYIGSSFWSTQLSIDPATGASNWQSATGGAAYSTPALTADAHYSGTVGLENTLSGNMKGSLVRLDRASGRVVWRFPFEVIPGHYEHGVAATPELVGGLILFGALDDVFYAIRETGATGGELQINQIESFDEAEALGSWQNSTAGSYTLSTITSDRVEGHASVALAYNLVADQSWGGSIDVQGTPAEGSFDFTGFTGLAMSFKVTVPASDPANVNFVFKLVDESTGEQEFWELTVPGVLGDDSGEWQQMMIPFADFALPSWTAQGDGVLDLEQITEWQFQVLASGTAVGTTTTGTIRFDRLGTYSTSGVAAEGEAQVPGAFVLYQNYPNPFNPSTLIRYELADAAHVVLKVFNAMGQEVAVLFDGVAPTGTHEVRFDATGLPTGVYYCRIKAGDVLETKPMLLVR